MDSQKAFKAKGYTLLGVTAFGVLMFFGPNFELLFLSWGIVLAWAFIKEPGGEFERRKAAYDNKIRADERERILRSLAEGVQDEKSS